MGFSEKECEACDRCGLFLPRVLTQYHQCQGSNKSLRPANIPLEKWLEAKSSREEVSVEEEILRTWVDSRKTSSSLHDLFDFSSLEYKGPVKEVSVRVPTAKPREPKSESPKLRLSDYSMALIVACVIVVSIVAGIVLVSIFGG